MADETGRKWQSKEPGTVWYEDSSDTFFCVVDHEAPQSGPLPQNWKTLYEPAAKQKALAAFLSWQGYFVKPEDPAWNKGVSDSALLVSIGNPLDM